MAAIELKNKTPLIPANLDKDDRIMIIDQNDTVVEVTTLQNLITFLDSCGFVTDPELTTALLTKADVNHTHTIAQVDGLQASLTTFQTFLDNSGIVGETIFIGGQSIVVNQGGTGGGGTVNANDPRLPDNVGVGNYLRISATDGTLEQVTIDQLKVDLSIENVDNTSDANKPVSTLQQVQIDRLDERIDNLDFGDGTTDLTAVSNADSVEITSSTGTNATISQASTTSAGVMSNVDKSHLDSIEENADVTDTENVHQALGITSTGATDSVLSQRGVFVPQLGGGTINITGDNLNVQLTELNQLVPPLAIAVIDNETAYLNTTDAAISANINSAFPSTSWLNIAGGGAGIGPIWQREHRYSQEITVTGGSSNEISDSSNEVQRLALGARTSFSAKATINLADIDLTPGGEIIRFSIPWNPDQEFASTETYVSGSAAQFFADFIEGAEFTVSDQSIRFRFYDAEVSGDEVTFTWAAFEQPFTSGPYNVPVLYEPYHINSLAGGRFDMSLGGVTRSGFAYPTLPGGSVTVDVDTSDAIPPFTVNFPDESRSDEILEMIRAQVVAQGYSSGTVIEHGVEFEDTPGLDDYNGAPATSGGFEPHPDDIPSGSVFFSYGNMPAVTDSFTYNATSGTDPFVAAGISVGLNTASRVSVEIIRGDDLFYAEYRVTDTLGRISIANQTNVHSTLGNSIVTQEGDLVSIHLIENGHAITINTGTDSNITSSVETTSTDLDIDLRSENGVVGNQTSTTYTITAPNGAIATFTSSVTAESGSDYSEVLSSITDEIDALSIQEDNSSWASTHTQEGVITFDSGYLPEAPGTWNVSVMNGTVDPVRAGDIVSNVGDLELSSSRWYTEDNVRFASELNNNGIGLAPDQNDQGLLYNQNGVVRVSEGTEPQPAGTLTNIVIDNLTFTGAGEVANVIVTGTPGVTFNLAVFNTTPLGWLTSGTLGASSGTIPADGTFETTISIPAAVETVSRTAAIRAVNSSDTTNIVTTGLFTQTHTQVGDGDLMVSTDSVTVGTMVTFSATVTASDDFPITVELFDADPAEGSPTAIQTGTLNALGTHTFTAIDTSGFGAGTHSYWIRVSDSDNDVVTTTETITIAIAFSPGLQGKVLSTSFPTAAFMAPDGDSGDFTYFTTNTTTGDVQNPASASPPAQNNVWVISLAPSFGPAVLTLNDGDSAALTLTDTTVSPNVSLSESFTATTGNVTPGTSEFYISVVRHLDFDNRLVSYISPLDETMYTTYGFQVSSNEEIDDSDTFTQSDITGDSFFLSSDDLSLTAGDYYARVLIYDTDGTTILQRGPSTPITIT